MNLTLWTSWPLKCLQGIGLTKISVDVDCFTNGLIVWGVIFRDYAGDVFAETTKLEKIEAFLTLPLALRLRWCLQWVKEEDMANLRIECPLLWAGLRKVQGSSLQKPLALKCPQGNWSQNRRPLALRFTDIRVDAGCFTNVSIGWGIISSNLVAVLWSQPANLRRLKCLHPSIDIKA